MGFFGALIKLFKGEPVFSNEHKTQQPAPGAGQPKDPTGPKVIPQVMIERWLCTEKGTGLHCEISIRNYSKSGVVLQRIEVLGVKDELGNHLDAGEHYEYQLHLSSRPKDTHLDECDVYFRSDTGDYFMAKHQIEFEKQPDGTFSILRFKLIPPIRDV